MQASSDTLAGIKVLDFSIFMAGPFCSRMLADAGATVVKVEPPGGDMIRQRPPMRGGMSTYFTALNAGKRSMVLDLKRPEDLATARALAREADVVLENFKPGVMQRLGLDYATLAADNPRLVYLSISGFGQQGPLAARPAYAPIVHAFSGYDLEHMGQQGPGQERPPRSGLFVADVLAAVHGYGAIQAALLHRHLHGEGQYIDLSLLDGMLGLMLYEMQLAQFPRDVPRLLYQPLKTLDGYIMVAPVSGKNFEAMCDTLGHPEWKVDPRFAQVVHREQNWDTLMRLMEAWTSVRTGAQAEALLLANDVPCARYLTLAETMAHPHLAQRGTLQRVGEGDASCLVTNMPSRFSRSTTHARGPAPRLGEHTQQVLREWLD